MWRRIKKFFIYSLALLLIVFVSLVTIIETNRGSRWVVNWLAEKSGVTLGDLQGNLREGMDLAWLDYNRANEKIHAENIRFRWSPAALLYTAVSINSLSVDSLSIQLTSTNNEQEKPFNQWPDIGLPVRIELHQFQIKNIHYKQGEYEDNWKEISGSLSLGTFHLRYSPLFIKHEQYEIDLKGKSDLHFPYQTDAQLDWFFVADTQYSGRSSLQGDLYKLLSKHQINLPFQAKADLVVPLINKEKFLQKTPELDLHLSVDEQVFPQVWWMENKSLPRVQLNLKAKGNWQAFQADLMGFWVQEGLPAVDVKLQAVGDWQSLNVDRLSLIERRPTNSIDDLPLSDLQASGNISWLPQLQWNADIESDYFNFALLMEAWPTALRMKLNNQAQKTEEAWLWKMDNIELEGRVRDLAFSLKGDLHQDKNQWQSRNLELTWGANHFLVNGFLSRDEQDSSEVNWNLRAPMLGQLDQSLSGSLLSQGAVKGTWRLPLVSFTAEGQNLAWPDGSVENFSLTFKPSESAENIPSSNKVDEDYSRLLMKQVYRAGLLINRLKVSDQIFSSLELNADGSLVNHQLNAKLRHNRIGKIEWSMSGELQDNYWQGYLQKMSIKLKKVPKWWLATSRPIRISGESVNLDPICLTTRSNQTALIDQSTLVAEDDHARRPFYPNASSLIGQNSFSRRLLLSSSESKEYSVLKVLPAPELCLSAVWKSSQGLSLDADLRAVPLRQFYAIFKPEVFFAGVMNGNLHLQAKTLNLSEINAFAELETRDAELRYQIEGGITEVYPWSFARLEGELNKAKLNSSINMNWSGYGDFSVNAQLDLSSQQIISAHLDSAFHNLQPMETLLPFTEKVKGKFSASIDAVGNFSEPKISGYIRLDNASTKLPRLGVSLKNINASVTTNDAQQFNLIANLEADKGSLALQGMMLNPLQESWQLIADLSGKDFRILNLLSLTANVNPAIHLDADAKMIKISGEAEVPYLRAKIKTIPQSAVRVSEDVILINEKTPAKNNKIPVQANLRLRLGDDVEFKGFGLDSKLSGDLKLNKEVQRPWLTNGFVAVKEGSYQAYGQALTIDRGRLIFQGDYENPGLDIRASRVIDDDKNTKVGLEITGSLQKPKAKVYSEEHSDSDAMMMLLTGKPLSEASKADASLLLAALSGLGVDSGQMIGQEVAQFFGVDEVAIKSDKGIDQSQLWIGKYITPKLLVRYVVGIFDQAFSLGMVYRLTDKVRIEAESGETQSLDMIYKIER